MPKLVTCTKCQKEVNVVSKKCPHCGISRIASKPVRAKHNAGIVNYFTISLFISIIIFVIFGNSIGFSIVLFAICAGIFGLFLTVLGPDSGDSGDSGDSVDSGNTSASNAYRAMAMKQRMDQQKELEELNDQVEDINDRMDGWG